jgi:hypothetical protein
MSAESKVLKSKRIEGLQVRAFDSSVTIELPALFMHKKIPASRNCIPTPEMAERWPYLQPVAKHLMPKSQCDIGLLIGYNCPKAFCPKN